jgi:hypothetical protein
VGAVRRALIVVGLCLAMAAGSWTPVGAQEKGPYAPGVGVCVPLPDPPLVLDWTIRALKIAVVGEVDCGL